MLIASTSQIEWRFSLLRILCYAIIAVVSGCNSGVYRASNLPVECLPPPPVNPETINLTGLADTTISQAVIQTGDVLEVAMVTDFAKLSTTSTPVRVADDGSIVVPLVGKVGVAGMTAEQAEQMIAAESISRGVYRNPCVTVIIKQHYTNKITVVGAVNKPGNVELPRGSCTLLGALVAAEGLCKEADLEVEIRRTDSHDLSNKNLSDNWGQATSGGAGNLILAGYQQTPPASGQSNGAIKVDLTAATQGMEKMPDLRDGDVVFVPKRTPKPVYVLGLVNKPGEYPYPTNQEMRLLDSIALAGGCSNPLVEKMLVIRQSPGQAEPMRIMVNFQAAKMGPENIVLAPGDTVSVEHTPLTAVADFIRTFIHVGFGASMSMW